MCPYPSEVLQYSLSGCVCGSGSCLTIGFRFLPPRLGTRVRFLRDTRSGRWLTVSAADAGCRGVAMGSFVASVWVAEGAGMLRELGVSELRYRAVLEVLDGARVTEVAARFGVARQTVHAAAQVRRRRRGAEP